MTRQSQTLRETTDGHRVVVVCGTGGVGKTTISSALALDAALRGKRVLVMTIDPARRLADSLGVSNKLNEATAIDVGTLLGREPMEGGSLHAMMLDAKGTWDNLVHRLVKGEEMQKRILSNRYYQRASESLSGSQEYMAMERLLEVSQSPDYDLIVLDTPPSRNALDFLEAPSRMVQMLAEGGLRWLKVAGGGRFSSTRAGSAIFGRTRQAMFSVFERFTGGEVVAGIAEFVTITSEIFEGMKVHAGEVMELLRSEEATFVLVASPNRISLSEALYFHDRLEDAAIPFNGFVINRIRTTRPGDEDIPKTPESTFPARPDQAGWDNAVQAIWTNHRRRGRWAAVDRHHIDSLQEHCGSQAFYVEVPDMEGEVHDLAALGRLIEHLN
ncbi:MAG: ArsA-related P-loop ATPase [Myxococcota bacterium]|nr:ArsA-related P-loop ATPase [Myxococcota bacterium]